MGDLLRGADHLHGDASHRDQGGEEDHGADADRNRDGDDQDSLVRPVMREGQKHAVQGPRGSDDRRHGRERGNQERHDDRHESRHDPAEEVELKKRPTSEATLEPRSEEVQHQHVEGEVPQAAVEEHVGDEGPRPAQHPVGHECEEGVHRGHRPRDEVERDVRGQKPEYPGSHGRNGRRPEGRAPVAHRSPAPARARRVPRSESSSWP